MLNKEQLAAVTHTDGPLLIVAGAGTGKTTVLIERMKHLMEMKLAGPEEILLLTFTEKGAGEMTERADKIMPYGYLDLWISTFHGFCEKIMRRHALDIGLNPDFGLIGQTEQWILVKNNLERFGLDYYQPLGNPNKFIYELTTHFSRLKDEFILPPEYLEYAEGLVAAEPLKSSPAALETARINELANAYHVYNRLLVERGDFDFGDLICHTLKLFKERPNILKFYQEKFKYIMVDEFQDTNWAQYELIKMLASRHNSAMQPEKAASRDGKKPNLMVVGDDNQAIYKFRGASLSNIMQFKDDFPEAREVVLSENYRSGQKILDAAYGLIKHNDPNTLESKLGISKRLVSMTGFPGEAEALQFETASDEEAFVAGEIRKLVSGGKASYGDCAVLVRANSQTDPFIAELNANGIPNIFVSLKGLYYKPVIMDMIAYLKLLDNYHESSALFRVLDMNPFEIGHADIVNINRFARRKNWSLFEALSNSFAITDISRETRTKIDLLLSAVRRHSLKAKTSGIGRLFVETVHDLGILKGRDHDRDREMYSLLNQFYSKISEYEKSERGAKLKDFIAFLDMELEAGETGSLRLDYEDADTVRIMTAHAAKGLEFKYVFLVQLVDKKFPTVNRPDRIPVPDEIVREALPAGKETHLEEERRLFYVAMTRAKEKLYLTGAKDYGGATEKKMSVFIKEAGLEASGASLSAAEKDRLSRDMAFLGIPPAKVCVYQPPKTFSFSQIEAYNNCPLQYKFNFVLKIPVVPKGSFVFGRVLHGILFDLFAGLARGGQASLFGEAAPAKPSLDDLLGIFKKNWQEEGYESKEEKEKYRKLGLEIISNFYSELEREGWPTVEFLEKSFMVKIGDYPFKGAIDRIDLLPDGAWEVIDYKTGETPENFYYQNKRQLLLYKIALEENTDKRIGRLTFHYLKSGEKKSFEAKDKDIEKLKAEITETVKKICSGEFQPNPGMLCRFCDFRNICEFRK